MDTNIYTDGRDYTYTPCQLCGGSGWVREDGLNPNTWTSKPCPNCNRVIVPATQQIDTLWSLSQEIEELKARLDKLERGLK